MKTVRSPIPIILSLLFLCSCGSPVPSYQTIQGAVWNTAYRITYRSSSDLSHQVIETMNRVERSLSPFLDDSRITLINRNLSDQTDSLIAAVFDASILINRVSYGAFDPTVAPLVNLWGFGYEQGLDSPTAEAIDSCLSLVGISECRRDGMTLIKKNPATQFNFSAITKGFGVDCVAKTLRDNGVDDYLVEIGGEIVAHGVNPQGRPWRVSVDVPSDSLLPGQQSISILELRDNAVATSGNYRNFRETSNGKVGHTISPVTGCPAVTDIASATVVAPDCMTADAAATAIMAMPRDSVALFMHRLGDGCSALIVIADGEGTFSIETIGHFPACPSRSELPLMSR